MNLSNLYLLNRFELSRMKASSQSKANAMMTRPWCLQTVLCCIGGWGSIGFGWRVGLEKSVSIFISRIQWIVQVVVQGMCISLCNKLFDYAQLLIGGWGSIGIGWRVELNLFYNIYNLKFQTTNTQYKYNTNFSTLIEFYKSIVGFPLPNCSSLIYTQQPHKQNSSYEMLGH